MDSERITLHAITPDELLAHIKIIVADAVKKANAAVDVPEEHLTTEQAMKLLQCSKTSLWKYVKQGKVKKYGLGRKTYFRRSELLDAIKPLKS